MKINTPRNNPRKTIYAIIGLALLFLIVYGLVAYFISFWPFNTTSTSQVKSNSTQTTNTVNYKPPTNQEINDSQNGKRDITGTDSNTNKTATTGKNISVGVSFAGVTDERKDRLEIRAFTPSIVEGDGTCTATLKKDALVVSKSSQAFVDATTSQCRPIYIPVSDFSDKGVWLLTVSYKSPNGAGTSETIEVNI